MKVVLSFLSVSDLGPRTKDIFEKSYKGPIPGDLYTRTTVDSANESCLYLWFYFAKTTSLQKPQIHNTGHLLKFLSVSGIFH